jgi:CBS domain-containing protein
MAIAMAQAGGIGVIHRTFDVDGQAAQVRQVKKYESGMVVNPLTIGPDAMLSDALALMTDHGFSGIPVVTGAAKGEPGKLSIYNEALRTINAVIPEAGGSTVRALDPKTNELCDLAGGEVRMENPTPMLAALNRRTASKADVDEASYVAFAGRGRDKVVERATRQLDAKFARRIYSDGTQCLRGFIAHAHALQFIKGEF